MALWINDNFILDCQRFLDGILFHSVYNGKSEKFSQHMEA